MKTSELAYAVEAVCEILQVNDLEDAYTQGTFQEPEPSQGGGFWRLPPFLPRGCSVFAPGVHRLRHCQSGRSATGSHIAKYHEHPAAAEREVSNAKRLAASLSGEAREAQQCSIHIEVVEGEVLADETHGAWVVLPVVEHECTAEWALRKGSSKSRRGVVEALASTRRSIEGASLSWRSMAPRNMLTKPSGTSMQVVLCDFERGFATGSLTGRLAALEEVSFCLEEFVNFLTDEELCRVFGSALGDLRSGNWSMEAVPFSLVDSRRQRFLLETLKPHAVESGVLNLGDLEEVRYTLREWQRAEYMEGRILDPIPLLDCVTAGMETPVRMEITRHLGEQGDRQGRLRWLMRLERASEVLTVIDLLVDALRQGGSIRSSPSTRAIREETIEWLMLDGKGSPPGVDFLRSKGLHSGWLDRIGAKQDDGVKALAPHHRTLE